MNTMYAHIVQLVVQAEAIIESRERQNPGDWPMTAFSRYRVLELLGLASVESYRGDLDADPASLLEDAATAVDQLVVPPGQRAGLVALADALRSALADVRMVCGACDV